MCLALMILSRLKNHGWEIIFLYRAIYDYMIESVEWYINYSIDNISTDEDLKQWYKGWCWWVYV